MPTLGSMGHCVASPALCAINDSQFPQQRSWDLDVKESASKPTPLPLRREFSTDEVMVYWTSGAKPDCTSKTKWKAAKMRPAATSVFRNQVHAIQAWFTEWNDCERTIALYSLLRQMKPIHARFLSVVMEHTFRDESYRTQMYEEQANDKEFLSALCSKSKDEVVRQLLVHLPLLRPGNPVARKEYLNILPKVLAHSHDNGVHEDECRQLLSLALVHPAFPPDERTKLQQWLQVLDENQVDGVSCPVNNSLPSYYDPKITDFPTATSNMHLPSRSSWRHAQLEKKDSGLGSSFDHHNGPPYTSSPLPHNPSHPKIIKSNSLNSAVVKIQRPPHCNGFTGEGSDIVTRPARSLSFPVDPQKLHKPLSPQSSVESETDDIGMSKMSNYVENPHPGMKDYFLWLKGLRLHKYSSLFAKISYDEMFLLKDADLGAKNVTKGAKTKILLSVQKLTERSQTLSRLEKEVHEEGKLPSVLDLLKSILQTPIKPFVPPGMDMAMPGGMEAGVGEDGDGKACAEYATPPNPHPHPDDLPSQLTKVIGKACTQLLVSKPNEDNFAIYISLLEKALNKEAFTAIQKKRLQSWKQQCQMSAKRFNIRRGSQDRGRWPFHVGDASSIGTNAKRPRSSQRPLNKLTASNSHSGATTMGPRSNTTENYYKPKHMRNPHALVSRTKSAPIPASNKRPPMLGLPHQSSVDSVEGINNSLESLCLSMTEHALADNTDCN